jgi:hypothetical protein
MVWNRAASSGGLGWEEALERLGTVGICECEAGQGIETEQQLAGLSLGEIDDLDIEEGLGIEGLAQAAIGQRWASRMRAKLSRLRAARSALAWKSGWVRGLRGCGTRSPARTRAWPMMRDRQGVREWKIPEKRVFLYTKAEAKGPVPDFGRGGGGKFLWGGIFYPAGGKPHPPAPSP